MSVTGLESFLDGFISGNQKSVFFSEPFVSKLQQGQIIKGRVLMHISGSKYSVQFSGEDKVVDSAIPLRAQEIIHGRVIGIGERVELQRIYPPKSSLENANKNTELRWENLINSGEQGQRAVQTFGQFQVELSANEQRTLSNMLKMVPNPDLIVLGAIILNKLGVNLSEQLLRLVYSVLSSDIKQGKFNLSQSAIQFTPISTDTHEAAMSYPLVELLAKAIREIPELQTLGLDHQGKAEVDADEQTKSKTSSEQFTSGDDQAKHYNNAYDFGRLLFNIQNDGTVAHRVTTIPILFGNKLIEVDIALFSQRHARGTDEAFKYRKIVFSLETDELGRIEMQVWLANKHVRIDVATERTESTEYLSKYMSELTGDLSNTGWELDELQYRTVQRDEMGHVLRSVVEHYVSQDSLSRLF